MNTTTQAPRLRRYSTVHYGGHSADLRHVFDIRRVAPGLWTVEHNDWTDGVDTDKPADTYTVGSVPAARALIKTLI